MEKELNIEILATKIQQLDTRVFPQLVVDIAKASKKKTLSSGTKTFSEYCKVIASNLTKQTTKGLVEKYKLA